MKYKLDFIFLVFYNNVFFPGSQEKKAIYPQFCVMMKSSLRLLGLKSELLRRLKKLLTESIFTFDIIQRHLLDEQVVFRMSLVFQPFCLGYFLYEKTKI